MLIIKRKNEKFNKEKKNRKGFVLHPSKMVRFAGSTILSGGRTPAFSFVRIEIVTCLWIVCTFGTLVLSQQQSPFYTQGRYGKREEAYAEPTAFFSGSRYGRAGGTTNIRGSKLDGKMLEVPPRVDRFYVGSRYGKRGQREDNYNFQKIKQSDESPRISLLKRYEQVLGYFDRVERGNRIVRTIDHPDDREKNNKIDRNNNDDDKENPVEISDGDKIDNCW